jgi:hypothetical protein
VSGTDWIFELSKILTVFSSYISELLGQPKPKENLMDFLSASSVLSLKLGRVDVRFHEPWSLKDFINEQQSRFSRLPQKLDLKEERLRILRTLGYKVLSEINDVSVVMPTALVGTILLTLRGRGVGKSELIRRVEWLSERVRAQGGRVAYFASLPTGVVVERALEVLGPDLVGLVPGLPEDTYYAVDRYEPKSLSSYISITYANQIQISTLLLSQHDNPSLHPASFSISRSLHNRKAWRQPHPSAYILH